MRKLNVMLTPLAAAFGWTDPFGWTPLVAVRLPSWPNE